MESKSGIAFGLLPVVLKDEEQQKSSVDAPFSSNGISVLLLFLRSPFCFQPGRPVCVCQLVYRRNHLDQSCVRERRTTFCRSGHSNLINKLIFSPLYNSRSRLRTKMGRRRRKKIMINNAACMEHFDDRRTKKKILLIFSLLNIFSVRRQQITLPSESDRTDIFNYQSGYSRIRGYIVVAVTRVLSSREDKLSLKMERRKSFKQLAEVLRPCLAYTHFEWHKIMKLYQYCPLRNISQLLIRKTGQSTG